MVAHALFDRSVTVSLCLPLAGCGSTALAMSSTSPVDMPAFATRLARAKFRAWHRGTREADYMIGGFFDRFHAQWGEAEMAWFEALLEEEDVDIMAWALGTQSVPDEFVGNQMTAMKRLDYVQI